MNRLPVMVETLTTRLVSLPNLTLKIAQRLKRQTQAQALVVGYLLSGLTLRVLIRDKWLFKKLMTHVSARYCTAVLKVLSIHVTVSNLSTGARDKLIPSGILDSSQANSEGLMIVANHLSYLDILILSSVAPMLFISSVEMRMTPLIGLMADLGGTLFVERRNRNNLTGEINEISEALTNGFNVVLFAESTSSNGAQVLPFKRSMLAAAAHTGASILPLTINYRTLDGEKISARNRDRVCWYGDMTFVPHFRQVIANENVHVELNFHPILALAPGQDTKPVALELHALITSAFTPLV